jgi:uncharacterized protein involved in type VI secretion and phage assembly
VSRIVEIIRRVVLEELARNRGSLLGVVTTVYPHEAEDDENNYEANVRLKHEDLELRRVPIAVGHVGIAAPPRVGDLVLVQFLNGDSNQPLVTGRFYHADERPPLHYENEIRFEQRLANGKLNHLRFTENGSILLQHDVTEQEKNTNKAATSISMDQDGNVEIKAGEKITLRLILDDSVQVVAEGLPITVDCDTMTVNGDLKVSNGSNTTTISGNEITGA